MSHTIQYNSELRFIELKASGTVIPDEFKEIFSQGLQLAKEKDCFLLLSDFREATEINISTMEIYNLPKVLSEITAQSGIHAGQFKRAIVVAAKDTADSRFAEDVAANQGQFAKFFQDIDEAKKWLLEK